MFPMLKIGEQGNPTCLDCERVYYANLLVGADNARRQLVQWKSMNPLFNTGTSSAMQIALQVLRDLDNHPISHGLAERLVKGNEEGLRYEL